jgi:anti-anti-sigma factor
MLKITSKHQGNFLVIALTGRIDASNSKILDEQCTELINEGESRLIFDLSGVNYISSAALRVFLLVAKQLSKVNGSIKICGLSSTLRDVFDISGFSKLFEITETVEEAL